MERCPVCKARFRATLCPRCQAELSQLLQIEIQIRRLYQQTLHLLGENRLAEALATIEHAVYLKREPLALSLRKFIRHRQQNLSDNTKAS